MSDYKRTMDTDCDRFVSPTVVFPRLLRNQPVGVYIPKLDDAAIVTLETAPREHRFNYPATDGDYAADDYANQGILLEWDFDDADGTKITDKVAGLELAEQGDPTFQVSAATPGLGKGVTFDGTGDAFDILIASVAAGLVPTTGDFSVEVVCKLTSGSGGAGDTIIACRTGADGVGWQLQLDANEHLDFHIEDADQQVAVESTTDVCTDAIVHLVVSCTRASNGVISVNGAAVKTTDISAAEKTVRPADGASNRLSIGGDAARTAGDCLFGTIYFVRLYNKALSATEVKENYNTLMHIDYPGWVKQADNADGGSFVLCKSGSDPIKADLTEFMTISATTTALRAVCSVEQTTTPTDLDFNWVLDDA